MTWYWMLLIMLGTVLVAIAGITAFQRFIAKPGSRRKLGGLGAAATSLDFIYHPNAQKARIDSEEQAHLPAPIPLPGDLPDGAVKPHRAVS